ncbi:MAG: ABC transporter ATP-binding protein [Anaerolineales bacterium]
MIRIEDFSYSYPGEGKPALRKINLAIPDGQFCGVVGANGASKSTLCYALSGFVPHFFRGEWQGDIWLGEKRIADTSLGDLAGEVGLVFQNPFNQISGARFSVREEIAFGLENLGISRTEIKKRTIDAIDLLDLEELTERSPFDLSGGQQQRVAIASILAMRPKLLVLDEPTSQLDPHSTEEVFAALSALAKRGGITVVLVEQKLEWLAEFTDRIVALDGGKLVMDDVPGKVLSSEKMRQLGVGRTQYSEAASAARKGNPRHSLPVTLKEAKAYLQ